MIKGYKCFNEDFTNRYGFKFSVGKIYITDSHVKFRSRGFHFCKNLEDTFRYFDAFNLKIKICEVVGSGNITTYSDEYYGYYDMYSCEKLEIKHELNRKEIIDYGLSLDYTKVSRFIQGLKLTKEEIDKFKQRYKNYINVIQAIEYYQENKLYVYERKI